MFISQPAPDQISRLTEALRQKLQVAEEELKGLQLAWDAEAGLRAAVSRKNWLRNPGWPRKPGGKLRKDSHKAVGHKPLRRDLPAPVKLSQPGFATQAEFWRAMSRRVGKSKRDLKQEAEKLDYIERRLDSLGASAVDSLRQAQG